MISDSDIHASFMMTFYNGVKRQEQDVGRLENITAGTLRIQEDIMKKKWITAIGSGALIMGIAVAGVSFADTEIHNGTIRIEKQSEAEFPSMAKVSMEQAVNIAQASVPGQVLKTGLEDEDGYLVYGVEVVAADKSVVEVKVDAGSGKVLAMEQDKADKDDNGSDESDDHDGED
jgi:uncharacterized membrane protein YkoI